VLPPPLLLPPVLRLILACVITAAAAAAAAPLPPELSEGAMHRKRLTVITVVVGARTWDSTIHGIGKSKHNSLNETQKS
jgi:hypothetical protein